MRTNETQEKSADSHDESRRLSNQEGVATAAFNPLSRRSFFGRMGASTAVAAATGVGLPAFLISENVKADDGDGDADDPGSRRERSYRIRKSAALAEREIPTPHLERR